MRIYYRISDNSYPKIKLPGATKKECLLNLIQVFLPLDNELTIIADNCSPGTLEWLHSLRFAVHETNLGNAGSLLYAITQAKKELEKSNHYARSPIYFVEDDYLHQPNRARFLLSEGRWASSGLPFSKDTKHYWTLYDHPDKYSIAYNYHETGKVTRTKHGHWRQSVSTTMTFATTYETLESDFPIWESFLKESIKNNAGHPPDHDIFKALNKSGRELYVSIPGASCHADLTSIGLLGESELDAFAIELMFDKFYSTLSLDPLAKTMIDEMLGTNKEATKSIYNLARLASIWECLQNTTAKS